jgi:hypothetical protein
VNVIVHRVGVGVTVAVAGVTEESTSVGVAWTVPVVVAVGGPLVLVAGAVVLVAVGGPLVLVG